MKLSPKHLIPPVVVTSLIVGGYFLDRSRAANRSSLTGTFESQPSRLAPKSSGRVVEIRVREGDVVRAGDVLVVLSAPEIGFESQASKEQARQAEATQKEVEAGARSEEIARQRALTQEAEANLQKLVDGPLPEEIATAEHRLAAAQAKYLALSRGSRKEEIAQAQAAVGEAKARLDIVRRGPNPEEREQLAARLRAAESDFSLATLEYERKQKLAAEGAIAGTLVDAARNAMSQAMANRDAAASALSRANKGAPPEEIRQAEAALRAAEAKRNEVVAGPRKEDVAAAAEEVRIARESLRLVRRGARSEDVDAARARLDAAKAALAELEAGSRREQIEQARAAARAASAQARGAGVKGKELMVRAPADGVVERVLVAVGDLAGPSVPVVQFSNPSDVWLRVYVPETMLASVRPGGATQIRVDGVAEPVDAEVESVATQGEFTPANLQTPEERGKQVFAVRLRLRQPNPRIKAGMAATVVRLGDSQ